MRTCFIVNPVAGRGKSLTAMEKCGARLAQAGFSYDVVRTSRPGDATALAQKLSAEGYELIVAAGGDGTICETAQGLIEASSPAVLGILPGGTGNDYCRCLSIPSRPAEAAEVLLSGAPRTVDVMQVDEFIGLNISTIGFDSAVAQNAAKFPALGRFSYLFSVLYTAARFRRPELTISLDDGQVFTGKRYLFAAGCGTHYGGGIRVLPGSDPGDGLLDYCMLDRIRMPGDLFTTLPRFVKGTLAPSERLHRGRARSLTIESPQGMTLNLDGNLFPGRTKITMRILPGRLRIMAPAGLERKEP